MKKLILVCLATLMASVYTWGEVYTSENCTVTVSGSSITVTATPETNGRMADKTSSFNTDWATYKTNNSYTSIVIEEGVTHIGAYTFKGFSHITSITIPTSVTSIGGDAFNGCTGLKKIYYSGLPSEWASINFQTNRQSHPFGGLSSSTGKYYFYGNKTTEITNLFIEPGITEIKQFSFHNGEFTMVCIPGTITNIRQAAFYNNSSITELIVNKSTAPILDNNTNCIPALSKNLYVPKNSSGYTTVSTPWNSYTKSEYKTSGNLPDSLGTLPWTLEENGVLTIDATGKATKSFYFGPSGDNHPWGKLRRMVYKIKIKGEMTGIGLLLRYHFGLSEVIIDQNTIPSCRNTVALNGSSYSGLYNKGSNYKLNLAIKSSALFNPANATNLSTNPWSDNTHWQVGLSDEVSFAGTAAGITDTLTVIKNNVDLPFTMQLKRSMSNAYYNTFCSPIPMSAEEITKFGAGTEIYTMDATNTAFDNATEELTLSFSPVSAIEAGKPYVIKPENNVTNPTFTNVEPSSIATEESPITVDNVVSFHGTLAPKAVTSQQATDKNFIILTSEKEGDYQLLTYANGGSLGGMRAYWIIEPNVAAAVKRSVMNIGNETQGIDQVQSNNVQSTKVLKDGQLYLMYEGRMYDVRGMRVE